MGKYKMPNVQDFFKKRRIYGPKKDPVWVYIKREMKQNAKRKPYNKKVANWLLFLKDLRYHYFCEAMIQYNRLCRDTGPPWYLEYSKAQRDILTNLKPYIHEDLLEDIPTRVRKALWDLGVTVRLPSSLLMSSMSESVGDPGLFMWILYEKMYKAPPSMLQPKYDLISMLLMSAIFFIDLDECVERLNKLTTREERPPPPVQKKKCVYYQPNVKYGEYLSKLRVPMYSNYPKVTPKPKIPMPLANKVKLRTQESYERLVNLTIFLEKRKQRNIKDLISERKCKYKFWEPPFLIGRADPKMAPLIMALKMTKQKAKKSHLKFKPPYNHIQLVISTVAYIGGKPVYLLSTIFTLPTGYIHINGGVVRFGSEYVKLIAGMSDEHRGSTQNKCLKNCDCTATMESTVMDYLNTSKCYCSHNYDLKTDQTVRSKDTFFYPPSRTTPFLFDHAKIYQLDKYVDYINTTFKSALASKSTSIGSLSVVTISGLKIRELLKVFLADLADSPLLIPHLPQADLLSNLQEWVRRRVRGNISSAKHKKLMLKSQRGWMALSHIDFRTKANHIPFTLKQLDNMNWSHRLMIQKLADALLRDFEHRTRKDMLEHARLFWSTMKNDVYPSKPFLEAFFTYMPGRLIDTYVVNPYCPLLGTHAGKTCPLPVFIGSVITNN